MNNPDPLLSTIDASEYFGGAPSKVTLEHMRVHDEGPEYVKVGRLVRYRLSALEAWLDKITVKPKGKAARA